MHAYAIESMDADDTIPTWQTLTFDPAAAGSPTAPESDVRLLGAPEAQGLAAERPTMPPAAEAEADDVMVSRIHLGPSVDEVLYRLTLGDLTGAALANEELEMCTPVRTAGRILVRAMDLGYLEEFMLASVDGHTTWGEVLDGSPFSPMDSLVALCQLVDKGALSLTR